MIVRILIPLFTSFVSGICFLTGLHRLMSGLLIGFGAIAAMFFGALFSVQGGEQILGFPVYGRGSGWPFFILMALLASAALFLVKSEETEFSGETYSSQHMQDLALGLFTILISIFLPAYFWFPSEAKLVAGELGKIRNEVTIGVLLFCLLYSVALYLLYRASKGKKRKADYMRRIVLTLFSGFHFDKVPVLIAYLLICSPDAQVIFPLQAALAFAAYLPLVVFLWVITGTKNPFSGKN